MAGRGLRRPPAEHGREQHPAGGLSVANEYHPVHGEDARVRHACAPARRGTSHLQTDERGAHSS